MNKEINQKLIEWKNNADRKPLILRGSKQINKLKIVQQFGNENYDDIAYFNFKDNTKLCNLFTNFENPIILLEHLSSISGKLIIPEKTLIIFDEIQECPNVLNSLKYFYEKSNEYHIICIGSSLGRLLADRSFSIGNVQLLDILL